MENEIQSKIGWYAGVFRNAKSKVRDEHVASVIMNAVGEDVRVGVVKSPAVENAGDGLVATEKQRSFLERLGVTIPPGCSKEKASELIDEAQAKAVAK